MFQICQKERSRSLGIPAKIFFRPVLVEAGDLLRFLETIFVRADFLGIRRMPLLAELRAVRVRKTFLLALAIH